MAASNNDFDELISEPREALDVEVKEWLDLKDNDHRAALAKEIIALANHGGGYVVVGFTERPDGSFVPALNGSADLEAWSQDAIQSIVAKYVDPAIQCRVVHRPGQLPTMKHPLIVVPGGQRVPVRAKAGSPDGRRLVTHRTYIRRAGPNSEEPRSTEEWDRLLESCLRNRQAELLDAMRSIMAGILPGSHIPEPTRLDNLQAFAEEAASRWAKLVEPLLSGSPPRLEHGYYDAAFAVEGAFERPSLSDLKNIIQREVRNHSGWPPFLTLTRAPHAPRPIDNTVEFWRGPEPDGSFDRPAHHDFWRASPEALLFTRRGYQEDGGIKDKAPGTTFDITSATWRLGEAILQASYIARALGASDANLVFRGHWTGLAGRQLVSIGNPNRVLYGGRSATQDEYKATQTVSLAALPTSLPEFVHAVLDPLYQLFDFFELPKRLVEEELHRLQTGAF